MLKKVLTLTCSALMLAAVVSAQSPPRNGPGPGGGPPQQGQPQGPPPEVVLKELLGFTDAQLTELHGLLETRRLAAEGLQRQVADAERALAEALHAETPDACNVGAKLLALESLRRQFGQIEETFRTGFAHILTADQQARVEEVFGLQRSLQLGELLHRLGL